jgi:hypothetical protein
MISYLLVSFLVAQPGGRLRDTIIAHGCYANHKPPAKIVDQLLRIETAAGFRGPARGLLVAAACNESGFNPAALGDWHDLITGVRCKNNTPGCAPRSYGILQFQGWAKRKIKRWATKPGDPRFDLVASATYWARHVVAQIPRVRRECGYPDELNTWRAAHRTAIVRPKCGRYRYRRGKQVCAKWIPRCHRVRSQYRSRHWQILAQWRALADRKFPRPVVGK